MMIPMNSIIILNMNSVNENSNNSRLAPRDRGMGKLEFLGIPNWLAFAAIGFIFLVMTYRAYF